MTPWKIAMEAAADEVQGGVDRITHPDGRRAYFVDSADMAAVHVLNQAVASLRALPEPPAFRAALEADEALLREALERLNAAPIVGKFGVGLSEYDRMCEALWDYRAENRALLAKLEERLK